jgi:hypothetical protein
VARWPTEHSGLKGCTASRARPTTAMPASAVPCCLGAPAHARHAVTVLAASAVARPAMAQWWPRREDMVGVSMRGPRRMRRARKGQRGSPRKRLDVRWPSEDGAAALIGGEAL